VLQVPPADIAVHLGDTHWMPHGAALRSRSAVMRQRRARASTRLLEQIVAIAAAHFEAEPATSCG